MKKVMLVDDEIIIRETIRECINWEQEGYIYCGDASDGEVALPIIEELQPDILITDIKMPFMDGLELISIVRSRYPRMKIIILSGHGEFEYARKALRMGVEEYCLKPVSANDILGLLREISAKIDRERTEEERLLKLKQNETENAGLTREKLLNDLCSGFITTMEALHAGSLLSIHLVARYYAVVISDIRASDPHLHTDTEACAFVRGTAEELVPGALEFKRSRTEIVWILKGDSQDKVLHDISALKAGLAECRSLQAGPYSVTVGAGSVQERLQGIHVSFLEAQEDKYWRLLTRQNRKAFSELIETMPDSSMFLDRARFIDFLKVGTPVEAPGFIRSFASGLKETDWSSSPIGYYILNDLTLEVFRSAKDTCRNPESLEDTLQELQQRIGLIRSWEEACSYIAALADQFWQWRSGGRDKYGDLLIKVKEYILAHYDKDHISLNDAAEHVNLSPGHLSKIFSQETGQTFIEFLTQTRIKKAMELLLSTQAKSYEIAFQVGYNDPQYFSNLFKRSTGMTTKEFRKKGQPAPWSPGTEREGYASV